MQMPEVENKVNVGSLINFGMLVLAGGISWGIWTTSLASQANRIATMEQASKERGNAVDALMAASEGRVRQLEILTATVVTNLTNIQAIQTSMQAAQSANAAHVSDIQTGIADLKVSVAVIAAAQKVQR